MKNFKKFWICLVKHCVSFFRKVWICLVKLLLWPVKKIWILSVKLCGWKLLLPKKGSRPEFERCVFVMAPHTSALDFIIGAAYLWHAVVMVGFLLQRGSSFGLWDHF